MHARVGAKCATVGHFIRYSCRKTDDPCDEPATSRINLCATDIYVYEHPLNDRTRFPGCLAMCGTSAARRGPTPARRVGDSPLGPCGLRSFTNSCKRSARAGRGVQEQLARNAGDDTQLTRTARQSFAGGAVCTERRGEDRRNVATSVPRGESNLGERLSCRGKVHIAVCAVTWGARLGIILLQLTYQ